MKGNRERGGKSMKKRKKRGGEKEEGIREKRKKG